MIASPPQNKSARTKRAFTLAEVVVAAALASVILLAAFSTVLAIGRTSARMAIHYDLEAQVRLVKGYFSRDVFSAENLRWVSGNELVITHSNGEVTYLFDPSEGTFSRLDPQGIDRVLADNVVDFAFRAYNRQALPLSWGNDLDGLSQETKMVQFEMGLEARRGFVELETTALSSRYMTRNKSL